MKEKRTIAIISIVLIIGLTAFFVVTRMLHFREMGIAVESGETIFEQGVYLSSQIKDCGFCLVLLMSCFILTSNIYSFFVRKK